jgi:hypothetical protein
MIQKPADVKYGEPIVTEKPSRNIKGVLSQIVDHSSSNRSSSMMDMTVRNGSQNSTKFLIMFRGDKQSTWPVSEFEAEIDFRGFVGYELVGQEVQYVERIRKTVVFFDPKSKDYNSSCRRGMKTTERAQGIFPVDKKLPNYLTSDMDIVSFG